MFNLQHPQKTLRDGFTLIELLMVIAIIGLLMTFSVAVMYGITDQASEEATVTTIQKVNRLLELRVESFDRAFPAVQAEWRTRFIDYLAAGVAADQNVPVLRVRNLLQRFAADSPVWDILAKKVAFRYEFPQRFDDLLFGGGNDVNGNGLPDNLEASLSENQWTYKPDRVAESSELLYFFLFHSGNFGSAVNSRDDFLAKEIADTDGDGLPEFVDAWGQPLRFYRWPTRLIDPNLPTTPFLPDFTTENDFTDLKTILSVNRERVDIGVREVDSRERSVAEILIKGLPRKLQFEPDYIEAACGNQILRPGIRVVSIIIPPDPLLRDPDDPAGLLYSLLETGIPVGDFVINFSLEFNEANYHTPDTFHAPLLMSPGPDGVLGLHEPFEVKSASNVLLLGNLAMYNVDPNNDGTAFYLNATDAQKQAELNLILNDLADNVTNRNRRAGGRR